MFRKTAGMSVFAVSADRAAVLRSRPAGPPERGPAEGRPAKTGPVRRRERQLAAWCLSAGLLLAFQALAVVPLQAQNTTATGKSHVIYGEPYAGKTVTANKGTITNDDGLSNAANGDPGYTYSYQWVRVDGDDEHDIADATDSTYTMAEADEGRRVRVAEPAGGRGGIPARGPPGGRTRAGAGPARMEPTADATVVAAEAHVQASIRRPSANTGGRRSMRLIPPTTHYLEGVLDLCFARGIHYCPHPEEGGPNCRNGYYIGRAILSRHRQEKNVDLMRETELNALLYAVRSPCPPRDAHDDDHR